MRSPKESKLRGSRRCFALGCFVWGGQNAEERPRQCACDTSDDGREACEHENRVGVCCDCDRDSVPYGIDLTCAASVGGEMEEAHVYVVDLKLGKYLLYQRRWRICGHTLHAMYLEDAALCQSNFIKCLLLLLLRKSLLKISSEHPLFFHFFRNSSASLHTRASLRLRLCPG